MHLHPFRLELVLHLCDLFENGGVVCLAVPLWIRLVAHRCQILSNLSIYQVLRCDRFRVEHLQQFKCFIGNILDFVELQAEIEDFFSRDGFTLNAIRWRLI